MTIDILTRDDTGEMLPVRVIDPDQPVSAPYSRAVGHLDRWVRDSRHTVDEFAAWIEGQAAQAAAEMRQLCDELELPAVQPASVQWAELPEEEGRLGAADTPSEAAWTSGFLTHPDPSARHRAGHQAKPLAAIQDSTDPVAAYMDADDSDDLPGRRAEPLLGPPDPPAPPGDGIPALAQAYHRVVYDRTRAGIERLSEGWTPDPAEYGLHKATCHATIKGVFGEDLVCFEPTGHAMPHRTPDGAEFERLEDATGWLARIEQWLRRKQADTDKRMGVAE